MKRQKKKNRQQQQQQQTHPKERFHQVSGRACRV